MFSGGNILSFNSLHIKKPNHATKELECIFNNNDGTLVVATLALGSRSRQRLAKLRAKSEARESHFMLPGG